MIHVFAHLPDGRFTAGLCEGIEEDFDLAWVDLEAPTPDELAWLAARFHFHPLAIEDCIHRNQSAKLEEYADHVFLVLHGLAAGGDTTFGFPELHIFFTQNAVVTVHDGPVPALEAFREKIQRDRATLPMQSDFLLYRLLDAFVDGWPAALVPFERRLEVLDAQLLSRDGVSRIGEVHVLQTRLNEARYLLSPQREILDGLASRAYPWISEKASVYLRDVADHVSRLVRAIEENRESLWAIRDATIALAAHRTNETMKRLTVFSVIFLPLTFVTGFFGMNFEQIPWSNERFFWVSLAAIGALPFAMLGWLRGKRWI
jgi:magnesium transporter